MKRNDTFSHGYFMFYIFLFLYLFFSCPIAGNTWAQAPVVKIGVLANRGHQKCLANWTPMADYLTQQVPDGRFIIIPLAHGQIHTAVQMEEVDFVLANSGLYVSMEHRFQINRIATLKEKRLNGVYTRYGGVVFCRSDRQDIRYLTDIRGKTFMAVSESSLGGWLMALREFKENGIDPSRDFKNLIFAETHDQVVYAVRDRNVEVGTVRTNTLEDLSAEGKIDLADFFVFPRFPGAGSPSEYFCTTREYPNWPMAKVKHTSDALAEKVALALLQMPADAPAATAAGCAGWTIPLNYQPVHDCLKALKLSPYSDLGQFSLNDVIHKYGFWIFLAFAAFCLLVAFSVLAIALNRKLQVSHARLSEEMQWRKMMDGELQQAKEAAETATRAKSEFLANMSHEIRTPMNGIIAAADLALSEEASPKISKYLKIIHESAYSLLSIVNDILDFSKIEAGKFELKDRIFNLNDVIDRVIELFFNKAAEKGIELLVDIDLNTPRSIKGDALRLQQILTNLISNAVKFTDSGGVILLRVEAAVTDAGADDLVLAFSVKDTGTGIAPEFVGQLFAPFSQADTSSTRKYEGTGLGLSICKQLVTMMGGEIGVHSELGKGSTFFFTVRMRQVSGIPAAGLEVPPDIKGLNVLVVDDLADSRTIMRSMLESLGCRVEALSSGPEALSRLADNILRNNPIELIMMDWKMPEMDGIEVSRKIRRELKLSMPIIMMTAFGQEEQRLEAQRAGINGFLNKPIYPSTLFDAIMDGFGKSEFKSGGHAKRFTTKASLYRRHLKGTKVLVAEDNPTNQQVAQAILEGAGIAVTIANHGEAAVEAFRRSSFDAILMDIQMPVMNGYQATRKIRELPRGDQIPIIAMTAHAMKGDEEKCLDAGMDGYVSKPINQDRLFHALWRLLQSGTAPAQDVTPAADAMQDVAEAAPSHGPIVQQKADRTDLPDRLPGIDVGRTLAAMSIDRPTLLRILHGFLNDNHDTADHIGQAFSSQDLKRMGQLAHALNGSAANIGAAELSEAAQALENDCRAQKTAPGRNAILENRVSTLLSALDQVLTSIQSLGEPGPGPVAQADGRSGVSLDTLLTRLADAIDQADPEQITRLLQVVRQRAAHCDQIHSTDLATLESQINAYDYDPALSTIRKIRQKTQVAS